MKINKEQLISLLAERTDMDRGDVHRQFVELVGRIQQAETEENTLEIEGFGTFMAVQDRLEFVPDDIFQMEVNNKYAGMKPIELIGAYKVPDGEEMPVAVPPEDDEFTRKDGATGTDDPQKEKAVPEDGEEPTLDGAADSDVPETPSDESPMPEKEDKEQSADKDKSKKASPTVAAAKKSDKNKKDFSADSGKSLSDDPLGKAIIIIICILIVAAAGWLAYDTGLFGGEKAQPDTQKTPTNNEQSVNMQGTITGGNEAPSEKQSTGVEQESEAGTKTSNEEADLPTENTPYGLYGELNTGLTQGYYTIVVHSLRTMDLAKEKKQEVAEEDFRVKINEASVDGNTYYRVGIGQFETVKAAQEAIRELPEPYKSNNFINRF